MSARLELLQTLENPQQTTIWTVAWNPSGTLLASCGTDKNIRIWGEESPGRYVCKTVLTDGHQRTVRTVAWSPCGRRLASASFDATSSVWERREEFECVATLEGHESEVKSVAWSASGDLLATCSRDKSVWIWEIGQEEEDDLEVECASVQSVHSQDVKHVSWHPTLPILCSASYDDTIKLFCEDDDDWTCAATLTSHESTVWCARFNTSGALLASCSQDRSVKLWRNVGAPMTSSSAAMTSQWQCAATLSGGPHERAVYHLDWSADGRLATACGDNGVRVLEVDVCGEHGGSSQAPALYVCATSEQAHSHGQDVNCVAWNPKDAALLASCSDDGTIRLWRFHPD
ncbi:probable cytosolic iron-sulfur protein assembly protein CIAO1 [Sycon ciliatum]|uniref:probable cytosolic iron-sulfur protein assembly protein CIAO1 n=1 Tax=Sycon ciliatum TaxID=27933 RepID=UPI0031F703AE